MRHTTVLFLPQLKHTPLFHALTCKPPLVILPPHIFQSACNSFTCPNFLQLYINSHLPPIRPFNFHQTPTGLERIRLELMRAAKSWTQPISGVSKRSAFLSFLFKYNLLSSSLRPCLIPGLGCCDSNKMVNDVFLWWRDEQNESGFKNKLDGRRSKVSEEVAVFLVWEERMMPLHYI